MSLIVARKEHGSIIVVSDTKLTSPNDQSLRNRNAPGDGIIKTVILNANTCISFAGKSGYAEDAIKKVSHEKDTHTIIETLLQTNIESLDETEFIFASVDTVSRIIEIKGRKVEEVESSWIGSKRAFNRFQQYLTNGITKDTGGSFMSATPQPQSFKSELFSKILSSMDGVIGDEDIEEVNGFKVCVVYDNKSFLYSGYLDTYWQPFKIEITRPGNSSFVITHGTAQEGAYTIHFFHDLSHYQNAGIHIKQGNFGIVYSREDDGLMKPDVVKELDEVDFIDFARDNYKIKPSFTTQSKEEKYFQKGLSKASNRRFEEAINDFNVAIISSSGVNKAKFLFAKGVALLHLRNLNHAMRCFQEAINLDSQYQIQATELVQNFVRNGHI